MRVRGRARHHRRAGGRHARPRERALVAYPELAPAGFSPTPYTGTEVGFSTLDVASETVRRFVEDVLGELAELTPGPYLHIGGDEAGGEAREGYFRFVERVCDVVRSLRKTPIGWEEIAAASLARARSSSSGRTRSSPARPCGRALA